MRYVPVHILFGLAGNFKEFDRICRDALAENPVEATVATARPEHREKWGATFKAAEQSPEFQSLLPHSMDAIKRIVVALDSPETTMWSLGELVRDLERRMEDELSRRVFLQVDPGLAGLLARPDAGWETAFQKFEGIKIDALEAAHCLAFQRWTASVFHMMRVMEFGLERLRRMVRVSKPKRPGWDWVIEKIDDKLKPKAGAKKSSATRKKHRFIAEAVLKLRAVKEARNTAMHDYTKTYNGPQALELYQTIQSFIQTIAEHA